MSMIYCHRHDRRVDTDVHDECPRCAAEPSDIVVIPGSEEIPLSVGGVTVAYHTDFECQLVIDADGGLEGVIVEAFGSDAQIEISPNGRAYTPGAKPITAADHYDLGLALAIFSTADNSVRMGRYDAAIAEARGEAAQTRHELALERRAEFRAI